MGDATAPRALVSLRGLAPRLVAGLSPARSAAVAVAAVAAAAQNDLPTATRAQVHTGGLVQANLGTAEGAGRIRPSAPHLRGTAFIGTV